MGGDNGEKNPPLVHRVLWHGVISMIHFYSIIRIFDKREFDLKNNG